MLVLASCAEDFRHEPIGDKSKSTAPGKVSNVRVKNTPGGAVIKYTIPDNVDLQYVKAVYTTSNGAKKDVKSSFYVDSLVIEGLGDTYERTVNLFAVNRMEKMSEPESVIIQPLTPPVQLVLESLAPKADFGGFIVNFTNTAKADVSIHALMKISEASEFLELGTMYTALRQGVFPVRASLPPIELEFLMYVRDKWDNFSDTIFFSLTPWKEMELYKRDFKYMNIAGDVTWNNYNGTPEQAFDFQLGEYNFAHTAFPVAFPHRYTLDLGVNVQLSRFKFYQRPGPELYQHGAPKHYRIYGRTDSPGTGNAGDVMNGWTLLMECNSVKPSGLALGNVSSEDVEFAARGEEFTFPADAIKVRYVRFEMLESWSGMQCSTIGEFDFFGNAEE